LGAKAYISFIIAMGALVAVRGYLLWQPHDLWRFACYMLLAALGSVLKVRLPKVMGTVSVLFVFLLAGVVELGLGETLVMSAVCVLIQSYWRPQSRTRPLRVAFSAAVLFIAVGAADYVYRASAVPWFTNASPFRLALVASVLFLANTLPVAAVISLTENRPFSCLWKELYGWTFPYYLAGAALVGMCGFVNRTLSWQAWILILPMVYAMYRSYQLYLDRLESQSRHAEEEHRHAEQVAALLAETMAANEALQHVNEELKQFAYAASHDLQEPLRVIAIYSELLRRRHSEKLPPDQQKLLDTITDNAARINDLVRDLLSYTRVGNADSTIPTPVNVAEVLAEVQEVLFDRIASVGAVITFGNLSFVQVHRTHLVQLLQNLLSNSLKYYSPDRTPRIHVMSVRTANGMTEMMVRDNGIGIDHAYHERIFGVFKRLHTRAVPGTGIGLAICKKIVQHYGGAIWVESQAGDGSTFHFTLPSGDGNTDADAQYRSVESHSAGPERAAKPTVADDCILMANPA